MGRLYRLKYDQAKKDAVVATVANTSTIATNEIGIWVGTSIRNNDIQIDSMLQRCADALREDGVKAPAGSAGAELRGSTAINGAGKKGSIDSLKDFAISTADETVVGVFYGATFPRAAGQRASLLFMAAFDRLSEVRHEDTKSS